MCLGGYKWVMLVRLGVGGPEWETGGGYAGILVAEDAVGGFGEGKDSPGFAFCKDHSGCSMRTDRASGLKAGHQLEGCGRGRGLVVWSRRWALETELHWTDSDDGISQAMMKDLLLVGEQKGKGREGRSRSWVNGGAVT